MAQGSCAEFLRTLQEDAVRFSAAELVVTGVAFPRAPAYSGRMPLQIKRSVRKMFEEAMSQGTAS
jgi:hypothetical protein